MARAHLDGEGSSGFRHLLLASFATVDGMAGSADRHLRGLREPCNTSIRVVALFPLRDVAVVRARSAMMVREALAAVGTDGGDAAEVARVLGWPVAKRTIGGAVVLARHLMVVSDRRRRRLVWSLSGRLPDCVAGH